MPRRKRVAPDLNQPLLTTDVDTFEGETAYDVGHRHAMHHHEHYTDNLPADQRQAYSRGYARGVVDREKEAPA